PRAAKAKLAELTESTTVCVAVTDPESVVMLLLPDAPATVLFTLSAAATFTGMGAPIPAAVCFRYNGFA
ncbi:MAG TPA: hypothetical protein VIO16_08310, partial [Dehalococcoidia bacterium]